jgi:hypothetical protein
LAAVENRIRHLGSTELLACTVQASMFPVHPCVADSYLRTILFSQH